MHERHLSEIDFEVHFLIYFLMVILTNDEVTLGNPALLDGWSCFLATDDSDRDKINNLHVLKFLQQLHGV